MKLERPLIAAKKTSQKKEAASEMIPLGGVMASHVVAALSSEFSRRILASTSSGGKSVQDISVEQAIPLSTCYRHSRRLIGQHMLVVERIVVTAEGTRYALYKSTFKSFEIASDSQGMSIFAEINDHVVGKLPRNILSASGPTPQV